MPFHCFIGLWKERRIPFDPTQEEPCLVLVVNSKPVHKEKETQLAASLTRQVIQALSR